MTQITTRPNQATLPVPSPTRSYWHAEPSGRLLGHRTTAELPAEADVVVVGAGVTGAFAARELVREGRGGRGVVCLEAREVCWGATGRNGGRCEPMVFLSKPDIARFEVATHDFLSDLVRDQGIACDWRPTEGVYALRTDEDVDLARRRIAQLKGSHPDLADLVTLVEGGEALRRLEVDHGRRSSRAVRGAVVQRRAASCWPYKLVCGVFEALLDTGRLNLQTGTAVQHVERREGCWVVHTAGRGQVVARDVVLATNAYTSYLLPGMTGLVTPVRGHVAAVAAPAGSAPLRHSHVWLSEEPGDAAESDDYLIQRADGDIVVGGERNCTPGGDWGVSDDGATDPRVARRVRRALRGNVVLFPDGDEPEELDAKMEWTGIMGFSADSSPWVGRVPACLSGGGGEQGKEKEKEGEEQEGGGLWLCAGYTGHGMPVAARCGVAIGQRVLGLERRGDVGAALVDVPAEWEITEERIRREQGKETAGRAAPGTFTEELRALVEGHDKALLGL
ncbi:hypothetical protein N3K66_005044 [Trichothecium roseum]|uniref:Uncharacterized protein n=1 Tax=Trichothecium roseum TaxID=47278 RepID=A0ACC0V3A6_9HYPO|nr:hypothetical protein N3K66_005044 [Trichothecium roseum]